VILVWIFIAAFVLTLGVVTVDRIRAIPTRRYSRCLSNIDRLERELGIGQPLRESTNYTQVFSGPFEVSHHDDIRFFDPSIDPKSALARDMMARGMLYSAEYEAARQMFYPDKQEALDD